jgi:hypothetical protein
MADSRPTAHTIFLATRASLRLVSSSTRLLSLSQLLAVESELRSTLADVRSQVQTLLSGPFFDKHPQVFAIHLCLQTLLLLTLSST